MTKDRKFTTSIHILVVLSYSKDRIMRSEDIAKSLQTNPGLVRRALSKLSKAGLVESLKGKNGGYQLPVPSDSINLKQIYEAADTGPLFRSFDKQPYAVCPVSCKIGGVLNHIYEKFENDVLLKMEEVSVLSIVNQIK